MDLTKLSARNWEDFLTYYFGFTDDFRQMSYESFESLYKEGLARSYLIDLYYASRYLDNFEEPEELTQINQKYTYDEIMNLTSEEVEDFDKVLHFNFELSSLETNREKIYRILNYLDLIIKDESILFQDEILSQLCSQLSLEDLNNFRIANDLQNLNCSIEINDKDKYIDSFNVINDQTYRLATELNYYYSKGSKKLFFEVIGNRNLYDAIFLSQYFPESIKIQGFHRAALRGFDEFLIFMLNQVLDPNDFKESPLDSAIRSGSKSTVKILLEAEVDPNKKYQGGKNALMLTAEIITPEIIELLIQYNLDINAQDKQRVSSLSHLIKKCNVEGAKVLLEAGAEVNVKSYRETPLSTAARYCTLDMIKILLDYKANPSIMSRNILNSALDNNQGYKIQILFLLANDPRIPQSTKDSALNYAFYLRDKELMKILIDAGADINNTVGGSPILFKELTNEKYRDKEMLQFLIDHRADPFKKTYDLSSPFVEAEKLGQEYVDILYGNR